MRNRTGALGLAGEAVHAARPHVVFVELVQALERRGNLALLLLSVRERVRARFQPMFREHQITEQQWRTLRLLHDVGEMGVTDIADAAIIARPSMVGILARMEQMGLVTRSAVAGDKRRASISLSPAGRTLVGLISPRMDPIYAQLEADLGSLALDDLYRVLREVDAALAEMAEPDGVSG